MEKYVVTINRQFGSMGRRIAHLTAEKLGIKYYDNDLVNAAAQQLGMPYESVDREEENFTEGMTHPFFPKLFSLGKKQHMQEQIFEIQEHVIRHLAETETCMIIGRGSDFILENYKNSIHVFIYAPYIDRVRNCMEEMEMSEEDAKRIIIEVDEAREKFHMEFAGFKPDDVNHKDILINSSLLGVEATADYLAELIRKRFNK